jgi:phosphatidylglycerol:prolipoprotein diacylglycerol transferase
MNILTSISALFDVLFVRWNVSPYLLHIGHFAVRWYGILFITGFILGYWMFTKFYKAEALPLKLLDPMLYMLLICALVGARLGHIIFYEPHYYFVEHPEEILKVWHGGLASHGGAIAILFGVWWYVHKYGKQYHFDFLWVMDRLAIAVPFAGMFIRLGNLMNSEIYGVTTSLPWGFIFERNGELMPKHPTQLYEALSYCLIGVIMVLIYCYAHKKVHRGFLFGLFLTLLFAARFFIEFVKEPQEAFENNMSLDMGQWLSIPFILVGLFFLIRSFYVKLPTRIYPVETPSAK